MRSPDAMTNAQFCAWLDANPRVEAAAILHAGRPLKAREILACCEVLKRPVPSTETVALFRAVRDRVMRRWAAQTPVGGDEQTGEEGRLATTDRGLESPGQPPSPPFSLLGRPVVGGRPSPKVIAVSGPLTIRGDRW